MDILSRIAWGNIDAVKEVWDFCCKDKLTEIKNNLFTERCRPTFWDLSVEEIYEANRRRNYVRIIREVLNENKI